jgi:threonyl-tRNA synthetase
MSTAAATPSRRRSEAPSWRSVCGPSLSFPLLSLTLFLDNFIFVVGADEKEKRMVNIRYRDDTSTQARDVPVPLNESIEKLKALKADRGMYNPFPHQA